MEPRNVLHITEREEFRAWLVEHHATEAECWFVAKKGKVPPEGAIWYLDAVEEALCFGWIDGIHKSVEGADLQRFTPRAPGGTWSELNKERCRRLEKLGLMTDAGRAVLPDLSPESFTIAPDILECFQANPTAWENFQQMPALYQRVRIDTIQRDRRPAEVFEKRLAKLIACSEQNEMCGEWNDHGRLLDY